MSDPVPSAAAPITPMKLAHVVLRTANYDALVSWWRVVLSARIQFASPFLSFLTYDNEHHRLAIINMPGLGHAAPVSAGVDHIAFTYADLSSLLNHYASLKAQGLAPYWCINHGPTTSLYYRDPDDNQVELQVDNFPTEEAAAAWFHSPAFAANPIGVEFDPDILLARLRAGVPTPELLRQGATQDAVLV